LVVTRNDNRQTKKGGTGRGKAGGKPHPAAKQGNLNSKISCAQKAQAQKVIQEREREK